MKTTARFDDRSPEVKYGYRLDGPALYVAKTPSSDMTRYGEDLKDASRLIEPVEQTMVHLDRQHSPSK